MLPYSERITMIEGLVVDLRRPRMVGRNARLGLHGDTVHDPVVRIHTSGGAMGIGWSRLKREQAETLLGSTLGDLFHEPEGCTPAGRIIDPVLWDLAARMQGKPLYKVIGEPRGSREVEVYDSSIYHDDYGASAEQAAGILTREVEAGLAAGYRNFKVKIGRGARWMPMAEGLERDILAIHTVRKAAGPAAKIMIDANDGGTVNSAKAVLRACAGDNIHWFEEPFAEARPLNEDLKEWMQREGLRTLIADGEYLPPPDFFDLMKDGLVDVLIADFRLEGASWWKAAAARIEPWGRRAAPHCWASVIDTYARAHFVATLPHFEILEVDPADTGPLVLDGWTMRDSRLIVPDSPGIGVDIDPAVLERGIGSGGYRVRQRGAR